jgi:GT2 family glycosyltransferase
MIDLSIVLPTCNRASLLLTSLMHIERSTSCAFEVIVVDGASTDATPEVLELARSIMGPRLRVIREGKRQGFVKATNKGFRAAKGRFMTWLNDDARPTAGSLDFAIEQLDRSPSMTAFVAMYHPWHSTKNIAYTKKIDEKAFHLCHVRGTLYANFCMGLRSTYDRLGYFDERYFCQAADPDLSLKAWHSGMSVVPAHASFIDHDEHEDDRRAADQSASSLDNERLFAKWDLPGKSMVNDFNSQKPCTLRGMLERKSLAA